MAYGRLSISTVDFPLPENPLFSSQIKKICKEEKGSYIKKLLGSESDEN